MKATHKNRFARILALLYLYRYQFPTEEKEKKIQQQFIENEQWQEIENRFKDFEVSMKELFDEDYWNVLSKSSKSFNNKSVQTFSLDLIKGTLRHYDDIEDTLKGFLNKGSLRSIPKMEHAILLQSIFELLYQKKNPKNIIINEAVELAKLFSQKEASGFINGILDGLAKKNGATISVTHVLS
jgi:transcription antitermination factor NusB